jgi:hypothetical protein
MKKKQSSPRFWIVLGIVNLLAIAYPLWLSLYSESNDALLANMMLVGVVFLMMVADLITIVAKYAME